MNFDNICKYLSEEYPDRFARWLLGETPANIEVLKTELSIEPIKADFLTLLNTQERILHLEFQVKAASSPPLPLRMLDYWVRLYRRYNLPVTQVIILLKETSTVVPEFFEVEQTRHSYRVVKMWEQDPEPLLQDPALLPLASLCRTSEPNQLLSRVAEQVANIETTAQKGQITACTEILAGLRFDDNLIKQLFREDVMQESVVYQRILREGLQQGLQQGLEQGLRTSILDALQSRFDSVPENLTKQLALLTPEILQQLNRQAWTCQTLEEFINQLPSS